MMARSTRTLLLLVALAGVLEPALGAGGEKVEPAPSPSRSPEALSIEDYNQGLAFRDQAWRLEDKLAAQPPDSPRDKLEAEIRTAYASAIAEFEAAVAQNPRMHQAYGDLGYAYRKTGDYEAALAAYDRALELAPDYAPAIEYRAEAYLGLNRIAEAQDAHASLLAMDEARADELLAAMGSWIEDRRAEPGAVSQGTVDALERWVSERANGAAPEPSRKAARGW